MGNQLSGARGGGLSKRKLRAHETASPRPVLAEQPTGAQPEQSRNVCAATGVSLLWVIRFYSATKQYPTLGAVIEEVIRPATASSGRPYIEHIAPEHLGPAHFSILCHPGTSWHGMVKALTGHVQVDLKKALADEAVISPAATPASWSVVSQQSTGGQRDKYDAAGSDSQASGVTATLASTFVRCCFLLHLDSAGCTAPASEPQRGPDSAQPAVTPLLVLDPDGQALSDQRILWVLWAALQEASGAANQEVVDFDAAPAVQLASSVPPDRWDVLAAAFSRLALRRPAPPGPNATSSADPHAGGSTGTDAAATRLVRQAILAAARAQFAPFRDLLSPFLSVSGAAGSMSCGQHLCAPDPADPPAPAPGPAPAGRPASQSDLCEPPAAPLLQLPGQTMLPPVGQAHTGGFMGAAPVSADQAQPVGHASMLRMPSNRSLQPRQEGAQAGAASVAAAAAAAAAAIAAATCSTVPSPMPTNTASIAGAPVTTDPPDSRGSTGPLQQLLLASPYSNPHRVSGMSFPGVWGGELSRSAAACAAEACLRCSALLEGEGLWAAAEAAAQAAVGAVRQRWGPRSAHMGHVRVAVGRLQGLQGLWKDMEVSMRQAAEIFDYVHGASSPSALLAQVALAQALAALDRPAGRGPDPEDALRSAHSRLDTALGPRAPQTLQAKRALGQLLVRRGRWHEAEVVWQGLLAAVEAADAEAGGKAAGQEGGMFGAQGGRGDSSPHALARGQVAQRLQPASADVAGRQLRGPAGSVSRNGRPLRQPSMPELIHLQSGREQASGALHDAGAVTAGGALLGAAGRPMSRGVSRNASTSSLSPLGPNPALQVTSRTNSRSRVAWAPQLDSPDSATPKSPAAAAAAAAATATAALYAMGGYAAPPSPSPLGSPAAGARSPMHSAKESPTAAASGSSWSSRHAPPPLPAPAPASAPPPPPAPPKVYAGGLSPGRADPLAWASDACALAEVVAVVQTRYGGENELYGGMQLVGSGANIGVDLAACTRNGACVSASVRRLTDAPLLAAAAVGACADALGAAHPRVVPARLQRARVLAAAGAHEQAAAECRAVLSQLSADGHGGGGRSSFGSGAGGGGSEGGGALQQLEAWCALGGVQRAAGSLAAAAAALEQAVDVAEQLAAAGVLHVSDLRRVEAVDSLADVLWEQHQLAQQGQGQGQQDAQAGPRAPGAVAAEAPATPLPLPLPASSLQRAAHLKRCALELLAGVCGEQHERVLGGWVVLGQLLEAAGDLAGAEKAYATASEVSMHRHGRQAAATRRVCRHLQRVYGAQGRAADAELLGAMYRLNGGLLSRPATQG